MTNAALRVQKLERELEQAREDEADLQAGLKTYAATCLLTAMRDAVAPMFAMGPAWTLLGAISGKTGEEISNADAKLQTDRILSTLHALRGHGEFEQDIKFAIHAICIRYEGEIKMRGSTPEEFHDLDDCADIIKT